MNTEKSILDRPIVLALNANWQRIGLKIVRQAILDMNSGTSGESFMAMNIEYEQNVDGSYNFETPVLIRPVKWKEWVTLPIRPYDLTIGCSANAEHGNKIRVPTVIISTNCRIMPKKVKRLTKAAIYDRDGGICQYSGRKVSRKEATVDHIDPRSKGGKDSWTNLVLAAPEVNFAKGNKSNAEAGLKLIRQPKAPLPMPVSAFITEVRHNDWKHFMED